MKYYADKRMSNDFQKYRIGQNVILLRREESKMSSRYEDKPYKVVRQRGTSVMLRSNNGHSIYHHKVIKCVWHLPQPVRLALTMF
jgi:hypothetical protein